jgi:hypothetical protein
MDTRDLYNALMAARNVADLEKAVAEYNTGSDAAVSEAPVGRRPNNRGAIEVATDPGRSLIERVTNAHDAILELEFERHGGKPECRSPREAAGAWLGVPEKEGLAGLTKKERQDLAVATVVRLEPGEGTQSRLVSVIDRGIGIPADKLEETILSLNESNKISKHYLAGIYGQGGSSTLAFCKYVVIASRHRGSDQIAFTVVRYEDLPAENFKTGRYVYLVENDAPLVTDAREGDIQHGTVVRHFGYDLTRYTSPLGPRSVYGILGRILFDPVAAIRLENRVHGWNRTIKGARNALNGAVDEGDDGKGPTLDHHVPMFNVSLGDYGAIGVEYWVLARPEAKDGKKRRTKPSENFVDAGRPIILSHNGQNQGEITGRLIKDEADLPYLQTQGRMICHVNCDRLTPTAKRILFASTREQSREGFLLERIRDELARLLKADDELGRLNEEAREQSLKERDETAQQQMRRQVARLLRLAGATLQEVGGKKGTKEGGGEVKPKRPRVKLLPITPSEPPIYIKIVWDKDEEVPFYAGQRRYLRVETDANSDYHDVDDPTKSRINIAVGDELKVFGTSPLKGGRMRIGVECTESVVVGAAGSIRIELYRKGLPALSDERVYAIVEPPEPKEQERKGTFPDFEVIAVQGPEDDDWEYICENPDDTNVSRHASNSVMNKGKLYIYYSETFPRFATEHRRFEMQNEAMANSFRTRYEMWLAVHSLLMYQEMEQSKVEDVPEDALEEMARQERCRHAVIAAMVAGQGVKSGIAAEDDAAVA